MACPKCKAIPHLQPNVKPLWANAGLSVATSATKFEDFVIGPGTTISVAPADPKRWAIGFAVGAAFGSNLLVTPGGGANGFGFAIGSGNGYLWFTTFEFGPLVSLAWEAFSSAGTNCRCWQVYNLPQR